jgi:alpha-methylacyl-CoA racemase
MKEGDVSGPLGNLRVVEFAGIGPAPFAGGFLGDMGADVVRIDRPPARPAVDGYPPALQPTFDFYNRNKRSVALDLKTVEGRAAALALIELADVVIEGFRPGVMERLGLGPDECFAVNPRLVYGRMTGWGQNGPLAQEAGHDLSYLALSGALHAIGGADLPRPPLNLVADLGGGAMYLVSGVLSAVIEASNSGTGQVVDACMVEGVVALMSGFQALLQQGDWVDEREANLVDGAAPFYRAYPTSDGKFVAVAALEPQFYAALLKGLGLADEDLPHQTDRAGWPVLTDRFARVFRSRTRDDWTATFAGTDACFAPVLAINEVAAHPHVVARRVFSDFQDARHASPTPRFSRTPGTLRRAAPRPGQHTGEVLQDWGVSVLS